jgi:hypothetical protein
MNPISEQPETFQGEAVQRIRSDIRRKGTIPTDWEMKGNAYP